FRASKNQEADQQQHRDTGNPTPNAADVLVTAADPLVTADHRVAQTRIRKTWISHGILLSSGRFVLSQHEGNPLAVTAVPNLDPVHALRGSGIPKIGPLRAHLRFRELPPKADMGSALAHVCFGPLADIVLPVRFLPIRRKARCRPPRGD